MGIIPRLCMVVKIKKIYMEQLLYSVLIITALIVSGNNGMEETSTTKAQGMCFSSSGLS